jgi:hypothetical protein
MFNIKTLAYLIKCTVGDHKFQEATMIVVLMYQECARIGEDVYVSVFHRNIVDQSIQAGHRRDINLHSNSLPKNLIRKEYAVISSSLHGGTLVLGLGGRYKIVSRMNFGLSSLLLMGTKWDTEHRLQLEPLFRSKKKIWAIVRAYLK